MKRNTRKKKEKLMVGKMQHQKKKRKINGRWNATPEKKKEKLMVNEI